MGENLEVATLGGGCFWCTEAVFQRLRGVESVVSGYAGGDMENPDYSAVSSGQTGHAEVIQIHFDPKVISYENLLEVFFATHDPTTMNRQGNDVGPQYRSVIFYHDEKQKQAAEKMIAPPIVTELKPFEHFYKAEDYNQNYFNQNSGNPYCTIVISPKLEKLKQKFSDKLKN